MNSRYVYWTRLPKQKEQILIAVNPFLDARDGRLKFQAYGSGVWQLTGELSQDSGSSFTFTCDDSVMGARGGKYVFHELTLGEFRSKVKGEFSGTLDTLAEICTDTQDLYFWFRHEWPNKKLQEYAMWTAMDNERQGIRTDFENKSRWEQEEAQKAGRIRESGRKLTAALKAGERAICPECSMRGESGQLLNAGGEIYRCSNCGAIWNTRANRMEAPPAMAMARGKKLNEELRSGSSAECPKCKPLGLGKTGNLFPVTGNPKHILSKEQADFEKARYFQCDICAALWDTEKMEWIGSYRSVW